MKKEKQKFNFIVYVAISPMKDLQPHFHIIDEETLGKKFHSCVFFNKPKYFDRGPSWGKLYYRNRKDLIGFLQSPDPEGTYETIWKNLIAQWNKEGNINTIAEDIEIPDYTKLD